MSILVGSGLFCSNFNTNQTGETLIDYRLYCDTYHSYEYLLDVLYTFHGRAKREWKHVDGREQRNQTNGQGFFELEICRQRQ